MPTVALSQLPKNELSDHQMDWQNVAAQKFCERLAFHLMEIEKLKEQSRFYHLPLGLFSK